MLCRCFQGGFAAGRGEKKKEKVEGRRGQKMMGRVRVERKVKGEITPLSIYM